MTFWLVIIAYAGAWVAGMWGFFTIGWKRGFDDAQEGHRLARRFIETGTPRRPDGF